MRKYLFLLLFIFTAFTVFPQQIRPSSSDAIYKEIKMLKTLPKVLYIAAHPDDENTGLLAWLINNQHINTAYLSLTRGDGGQNLLGSEQGAALGLIRTQELLEARKVDGATQYFSSAVDFGFSKNPEDTFSQWNKDSIVADVVWIIRKFRPDVVITRFPPTSAAGHGQHSASAIIAEEAFKAAGDKNRFKDQLKDVAVWTPKRLLWNTFRFGSVNTTNENQLKVQTGQYDPLLAVGLGELAGISRSLHQSQGAGTPSIAGIRTEYFSPVLGEPAVHSIFDGLNATWSDIQRKDIDQEIDLLVQNFNFNRPDLSIPALIALKKKLEATEDTPLKEEKTATLNKLILSASGFMAEMLTNKPEALTGETMNFTLHAIARSQVPVAIQQVTITNKVNNINQTLPGDSLVSYQYQVTIPDDTPLTEPYWLAHPKKSEVQYEVKNNALLSVPVSPPTLSATLSLKIQDETFQIDVPFSYKKLDPIKGDVVEALRIVPPVTIQFAQSIFFPSSDQLNLRVNLHAYKDISGGNLLIKKGQKTLASLENITLPADSSIQIPIEIKQDLLKQLFADKNNNTLQAAFIVNGNHYNKQQHLIRYNHIPTLQYFTPAEAHVLNSDLKVSARKVGYIPGAGDFIPEFLQMAGIEVTILNASNLLKATDLSSYDAIVTGIRAINVERKMPQFMPVLNEYIHNGGTVIMQFNTLQDMSTTKIGPYPFSIGRDRVTEENSTVTFTEPSHALLNTPNKISPADFNGWVQERGVYFPSRWDSRYTTLFNMNDTGEEELESSTLYASYGKGHFVYTSLAFFRQLPAGNAGAAKLFFNMLSLSRENQ